MSANVSMYMLSVFLVVSYAVFISGLLAFVSLFFIFSYVQCLSLLGCVSLISVLF